MKLLYKAKDICRNKGLKTLIVYSIRFGYRKTTRSFLPTVYVNYNGVEVPAAKILDPLFGEEFHRPSYEEGLIRGLNSHVEADDRVVIIGGGFGVTAVKAARKTEDPTKITVYEGSKDQIKKMKKTFERNNIEGINIQHSIVGPKVSIRGKAGDHSNVEAGDIPECDILELDCEGSEIEILENLEINPRTILVESHGLNGAPSDEVKEKLDDIGYSVENIRLAEDDVYCEKNDIKILTATK